MSPVGHFPVSMAAESQKEPGLSEVEARLGDEALAEERREPLQGVLVRKLTLRDKAQILDASKYFDAYYILFV